MPKIAFSDIDGTLIHRYSQGFGLIKIAYEAKYVSLEAITAITEFRAGKSKFALVTGRRKSGYDRVAQAIPHDFAIIEHGCIVLDEGKVDEDWAELLKPVIGTVGAKRGLLWDYEQQLLKEGFKTDSGGRLATVRIYVDRPDNLSEEERALIQQKIAVEVGHLGIATTQNENMLDMLPAQGGKANSIRYIVAKHSHSLDDIIALVNDINDLDMLQIAKLAACPGNAISSIKQRIAEIGGYISPYSEHAGTADMLRNYLLSLV